MMPENDSSQLPAGNDADYADDPIYINDTQADMTHRSSPCFKVCHRHLYFDQERNHALIHADACSVNAIDYGSGLSTTLNPGERWSITFRNSRRKCLLRATGNGCDPVVKIHFDKGCHARRGTAKKCHRPLIARGRVASIEVSKNGVPQTPSQCSSGQLSVTLHYGVKEPAAKIPRVA
jgi:hypothetical protein